MALIIAMVLIVIALGLAILAVSWGGVPETLYRLGLSEGWTEEEEDQVREQLGLFVEPEDQDCVIDELQKRFTFDEIQNDSADIDEAEEALDGFNDAAEECGIDTEF